MRPQQNRRMRGRGNGGNNGGGRKGPNPLTRSYESNGPDVKIRGSAQQIAEKYTTLARDAQSSGDRVMAENYLQHAEHYNRIIMAAQAQMPMHQQVRDMRDDDDLDDEGDDGFQQPQPQPQQAVHEPAQRQHRSNANANGSGPQPVIEGTPAEVALKHGAIGGEARERPAEAAPAEQKAEVTPGDQVADQAEAGSDQPAPRRPRRPRRPRLKAGETPPGDDQPSGDEEPVTEAAQ